MKKPINLHEIPALKEIIICDEIKLRPLQHTDTTAILKILEKDKSIRKRVSVASKLHTEKDIADEIDHFYKNSGLIRYVIVRNNTPIGLVSLWRNDGFLDIENMDDYGFGYFLDPNERGKGLVTRAVQRLMDEVIENLYVNQFIAFCEDANHGSLAVLKKLGFEPTDKTFTEPNNGWIERKYIKVVSQ